MTGYINIISIPPGAKIYINDTDTTFLTPNTLVLNNISSWTGKITLKLSGYQDNISNVTLVDGQTIDITANLIVTGTTTTSGTTSKPASPLIIVGAIVGVIILAYIFKTATYKFESSAAKRAGVRYVAT